MLSFFPRGVLDEILNLIESVSEGFPSYYLDTEKHIFLNMEEKRSADLQKRPLLNNLIVQK